MPTERLPGAQRSLRCAMGTALSLAASFGLGLEVPFIAPVLAWLWVKMGKNNPIIPRKFGLGLIFNGLAFLLLMMALSGMVDANGKIPFWTLFMVYVIQSVGELCLSPIGLSMTTKLAPSRLAGMAMGCWFLSIAIGNNMAGIFAGKVSA